jgi:hypothetical protein
LRPSYSGTKLERVPKSAISSISSISSGEDIEDIEDFDSEQMPTSSESVTDLRPSLLLQIVAKAVSPEDADLPFVGQPRHLLGLYAKCLRHLWRLAKCFPILGQFRQQVKIFYFFAAILV